MFKYQSFNSYSKINLLDNAIYFNHHDNFNDPFECWCIEKDGHPEPVVERERFLSVIQTWGFTADRVDEALEHYKDYVEELGDWPGIINNRKNSARIACFSSEADNLLMWSHYADGLRGFCVEFDETAFQEVDSSKSIDIHSVQYRTSPAMVDSVAYSIANDMYWHNEDVNDGLSAMFDLDTKVLATKPFQWAYECEKRAIIHVDESSREGLLLQYDPRAIKRIIVGEKAEDVNIEYLNNFIKKNNLSLSLERASRDSMTFNVNIQTIKDSRNNHA